MLWRKIRDTSDTACCLPADSGDMGLAPESERSPGVRKWQPTPLFLSGESHGWRSLVGWRQSIGQQRIGHGWSDSAHTRALSCVSYTLSSSLWLCFKHRTVQFFRSQRVGHDGATGLNWCFELDYLLLALAKKSRTFALLVKQDCCKDQMRSI